MAYQKIPFTPDWGGVTDQEMNHIQTQYDEAAADLADHAAATPLDHPDGSVTLAKLALSAMTSPGGTEANRLARTNGSGRVGDSERLGGQLASAYALAPVGINQLKTATGSASTSSAFTVHRYAFASPSVSRAGTDDTYAHMGFAGTSGSRREWRGRTATASSYNTVSVTWDYLTSSGDPRIWAVVDDAGNIHDMWEAEDPADPEFPDDPPLHPKEMPQSWALVPVEMPDEALILALMQRLQESQLPSWHGRSIYKTHKNCRGVCDAAFHTALQRRWLEEPEDVREVYSAISDKEKRYWYLQLWLRAASRVMRDHESESMIPLYKEMLRVDKRTGKVELR